MIMTYKKHGLNNIARSTLERIIDEYVIGFKAKRNRKLLKLKWIDGLTFEELAEVMEMSESQVKKITYDYEDILCEHLRVGK